MTNIPSMGGTEIGDTLRHFATAVPADCGIVEVGCWLGAGTLALAQGSALGNRAGLHVYDRFRASRSEVAKASAFGVTLTSGQDTLPLVRKTLAGADVPITFHKGDLLKARAPQEPVHLYVDDASKSEMLFRNALRRFGPTWVAGETVLVLMDFHFWKSNASAGDPEGYAFQSQFIQEHRRHFEPITDHDTSGTSTAIFRYVAPFDFSSVAAPRLTVKQRIKQAMRRNVVSTNGK